MKSRMMRAAAAAAFAAGLSLTNAAGAGAQPAEVAAPFERYGHIERFKIKSAATGRSYAVSIYRPPSYATSGKTYPALFMLDGDYAFDAAVALSSYLQRGEIGEHLIVGISNDVPFGEPLAARRTPDFTPPRKDGVMTRETVAPYYRFLKEELLPQVQQKVRVDPAQKTLWGYSLSGSFATWVNYYDHALFQNYIIASPNWEQFGIQQRLMEGAVFNAPSAGHKLFLSFDVETELAGVSNAESALKGLVAGSPGYKGRFMPTHGETHSSSWLVTMPAALRFVYGPD